jgi:SpoVK/Ycf46/Vps4 family AAA+-type ATPase
MGLSNNEQKLIKAVAEKDIREARVCALAVLAEDTTQKNKYFVNRYRQILQSEGAGAIVLPGDLKDIMLCEDVSLSFNENRYYLTESEKQISGQIFNMAKVSEKLMEMQIPYKNATLLYGPPGTGKTLFGKYIAYKMNLPFCYLNFSRVVDSYMGATSRNIAKAFTYASSNPCVFMLDEVDTISCNRMDRAGGGDSAGKEMARVTVTLMQEFDRLANDVVIIAATNRLDIMDEAFVSRFPLKYEILPFSEKESVAMVKKFLNDVKMDFSDEVIEEIIKGRKDQREIMGCVIRKIAERLLEQKL